MGKFRRMFVVQTAIWILMEGIDVDDNVEEHIGYLLDFFLLPRGVAGEW